jgi:2',3'-cyclic-nucleotide 2'-phosphodiesterase/3'-nucleotidase
MGDFIAYERGMRDGDVHPVIKGMNALGFDAATLGNHEFNYGLDFMMKVLSGADFPVVCANLVKGTALAANPRDDSLFLKPYTIVDRQITDGARQQPSDPDRVHRLRPAADHELGPPPPGK